MSVPGLRALPTRLKYTLVQYLRASVATVTHLELMILTTSSIEYLLLGMGCVVWCTKSRIIALVSFLATFAVPGSSKSTSGLIDVFNSLICVRSKISSKASRRVVVELLSSSRGFA